MLLAAGADFTVREYGQRSLLHAAASHGHPQIAQALMQVGLGVDVEHDLVRFFMRAPAPEGPRGMTPLSTPTQIDITPLHEACANNNAECARVLISAGADTRAIGGLDVR